MTIHLRPRHFDMSGSDAALGLALQIRQYTRYPNSGWFVTIVTTDLPAWAYDLAYSCVLGPPHPFDNLAIPLKCQTVSSNECAMRPPLWLIAAASSVRWLKPGGAMCYAGCGYRR